MFGKKPHKDSGGGKGKPKKHGGNGAFGAHREDFGSNSERQEKLAKGKGGSSGPNVAPPKGDPSLWQWDEGAGTWVPKDGSSPLDWVWDEERGVYVSRTDGRAMVEEEGEGLAWFTDGTAYCLDNWQDFGDYAAWTEEDLLLYGSKDVNHTWEYTHDVPIPEGGPSEPTGLEGLGLEDFFSGGEEPPS